MLVLIKRMRKKVLCIVTCLIASCTGFAAADEPAGAGESGAEQRESVLIVYLSRTDNTRAVAEIIHQRTGGDIAAIELQTPYPDDYRTTVKQVSDENASGYSPPLKPLPFEVSDYQHVFIGFPTWGMQLPPPLKSFVSCSDLAGKNIYPFNTNAGYGLGSSLTTLKSLCTNCRISEAFSTTGGIERDGVLLAIKDARRKEVYHAVHQWLDDLNIEHRLLQPSDKYKH